MACRETVILTSEGSRRTNRGRVCPGEMLPHPGRPGSSLGTEAWQSLQGGPCHGPRAHQQLCSATSCRTGTLAVTGCRAKTAGWGLSSSRSRSYLRRTLLSAVPLPVSPASGSVGNFSSSSRTKWSKVPALRGTGLRGPAGAPHLAAGCRDVLCESLACAGARAVFWGPHDGCRGAVRRH